MYKEVGTNRIAFFDFDGTLTRNDTFISFGKFALGSWKFAVALLKTFIPLASWKLGFNSSSNAKQKLFSNMFRGWPKADFDLKGKEFASVVDQDLRRDVMERLRHHQQNGDETAIVSASIYNWIAPWAKANGIDSVLSTEAETDENGRLTGRFKTPNCLGEEKVRRIRNRYPDLMKYEIWAYGDSQSDKPMLSIAQHPLKV